MHRRPCLCPAGPVVPPIINSVLNITLNLVDHNMTIQQAIDAPRLSVTSALGTLSCETGQPFMPPAFSDATLTQLRALGHFSNAATGALACSTTTIGPVQGVIVDLQTGKQYGGADQRREGTVIGLPRPGGKK